MAPQKTAVVVYAGTFEKKDGVYVLGLDTEGRCKKALEVLRKEPNATLFLNAGAPPECPKTTHAKVMSDWFWAHGWDGNVVISEKGYDTATETAAAFRSMEQFGGFDRIVAVTSWYHVPRVKAIWLLLFHRRAQIMQSHETENAARSIIREIAGFGKLLFHYFSRGWIFGRPVLM